MRTVTHYALSLHDALPICRHREGQLPDVLALAERHRRSRLLLRFVQLEELPARGPEPRLLLEPARRSVAAGRTLHLDRKSTRLNSSHLGISDAVFCLKKKR